MFQCSSASRKFLNSPAPRARAGQVARFSALQRAENSSIHVLHRQLTNTTRVSVLFSEPKIPQFDGKTYYVYQTIEFQCSSASRKFLNRARESAALASLWKFQCSSASRKFLNIVDWLGGIVDYTVSVLFSEPKIPQSRPSHLRPSIFPTAMITLRHS